MNKCKIRIKEILDLTLEIIYLLAGESYPIVKSGHQVLITVPPTQSILAGRINVQKILELAKKMTDMLTKEIGNAEETDIMEDWPSKDQVTPTERCPNLTYSRDSTQEHHNIPHLIQSEDLRDTREDIKKEAEMYVRADQQSTEVVKMMVRIKEEESSTQICTRELYVRNIFEGHLDIKQNSPGETPVTSEITRDGSSFCKSETCSELSEYSTLESGFVEDQKVDKDICSFRCSDCGKGFAGEDDCDKHQGTHSTMKPFSCSDCEKRFQVKSKLIRHVRVHTGEKPFSCTMCGRCFSNKKNLAIHVRRLHPDNKLFSCSDCGMCFQEKGRLVMHRRIHSSEKERPYTCLECQKSFTKNSDLVRHHRTHTGEKPFSCSECGKCFAQKAQLITHLRVHRVEKPTCS